VALDDRALHAPLHLEPERVPDREIEAPSMIPKLFAGLTMAVAGRTK
jgi:hypothetical protein